MARLADGGRSPNIPAAPPRPKLPVTPPRKPPVEARKKPKPRPAQAPPLPFLPRLLPRLERKLPTRLKTTPKPKPPRPTSPPKPKLPAPPKRPAPRAPETPLLPPDFPRPGPRRPGRCTAISRIGTVSVAPELIYGALVRYGVEPADAIVLTAIARVESGWKLDSLRREEDCTVSYGLFQVNSVHGIPGQELMSLEGNVRAAVTVFRAQGYDAWRTTWRSGAWREWVPVVEEAVRTRYLPSALPPKPERQESPLSPSRAFAFPEALEDAWRLFGRAWTKDVPFAAKQVQEYAQKIGRLRR